jgi:hypothetical protein
MRALAQAKGVEQKKKRVLDDVANHDIAWLQLQCALNGAQESEAQNQERLNMLEVRLCGYLYLWTRTSSNVMLMIISGLSLSCCLRVCRIKWRTRRLT